MRDSNDLPDDVHSVPRSMAPVAARTTVAHKSAPIIVVSSSQANDVAEALWKRLMSGEDFWAVVHRPFKSHDLTRRDLRAVIFKGLQHTRGNYRQLVRTFHMPDTDYKRFLSFLSQHDCNLPFQAHRSGEAQASRETDSFEVAC